MRYLRFIAAVLGIALLFPGIVLGAVCAFYYAAFKIGFQMVSDGI